MNVRYHMVPPPPQLAAAVRFFWVFEIDGVGEQPYVYRSMADGCAEMVFHYHGVFQEVLPSGTLASEPLAHLHAQSSRSRRFVTSSDFGILGVYVFPHALPRLFGFGAGALSGEMPDLVSLMGREGRILEEQVMGAPHLQARLQVLQACLTRRWQLGAPGHSPAIHAVQALHATQGQLSAASLADLHAVSPRQLQRYFHDYAGFSPKVYARILRFQAALKRYGPSHPNLAQIALDCGYYDQAHFNRDFRQFSGYSPGEYFHGRPEGIEYREA